SPDTSNGLVTKQRSSILARTEETGWDRSKITISSDPIIPKASKRGQRCV
ncbi:hypothetical protein SARC_12003, partial [Sphaeroforma arctica JP610]